MKAKAILTLALIVTAGTLWAQPAPADLPEPPPGPQGFMLQAGPMPPPGGGGEIHIRTGGRGFGMSGPGGFPGGAWWKDSQLVQAIGLSDQQVQQIEKTFQDHRMQLVDLHANLEKAELQMEPMMESDQPNEAQVNAQIDKVAQARAALEKSNAQMLFAVRRVLTPDQWKKLQAQHHERRPGAMGLRGPGGPGEEMGFSRTERTRRPRTPQPGQPAQPAPAPQPPQE